MSEETKSNDADWFSQLREGVADTDSEEVEAGDGQGDSAGDEAGDNKGGRPAKPAAEKKTERITVSFTEAQRAGVEAKAEEAGLAVAAFIRSAALGKDVAGKVDAETRRELRRIGVNLNQLAKVANTTGEIEVAERLDIVLDAVNKAARSIK